MATFLEKSKMSKFEIKSVLFGYFFQLEFEKNAVIFEININQCYYGHFSMKNLQSCQVLKQIPMRFHGRSE